MFCCTAGDETGGSDVEDWRERERDLQSAYQLPWSGYPEDSQGVSVVVGACDETMNGVKAV